MTTARICSARSNTTRPRSLKSRYPCRGSMDTVCGLRMLRDPHAAASKQGTCDHSLPRRSETEQDLDPVLDLHATYIMLEEEGRHLVECAAVYWRMPGEAASRPMTGRTGKCRKRSGHGWAQHQPSKNRRCALTRFAAADFSRIRNAHLGRSTLGRPMKMLVALNTVFASCVTLMRDVRGNQRRRVLF